MRLLGQIFCCLVAVPLSFGQADDPRIRIRVFENGIAESGAPQLSNSVFVDEIGSSQKGQLERIDHFLNTRHWTEALELLSRLLESDLSKLVAVVKNDATKTISADQSIVYGPLSLRIRQLLSRLEREAPDVFAQYQTRIDPLAAQWLKQAKTTRSSERLKRILNESVASSHESETIILLGDLSLERGCFDAARRYYRRISPSLAWQNHSRMIPFWKRTNRGELPSSISRQLVEKSADDERAGRMWARLALVSILEGNRDRASTELAILRRGWPNVEDKIGGIEGPCVDRLRKLFADTRPRTVDSRTTNWPTFAGNELRNRVGTTKIDIPLKPSWRVPLSVVAGADETVKRRFELPQESAGEISSQPCSHFPVVVGDIVLIKDDQRMRALNLKTGDSIWSRRNDGGFFENTDYVRPPAVTFGQQGNAHLGQMRLLVSSANGWAFSTFGASQDSGKVRDAALVGFDLRRQGAIQFGPVLSESANWSFHGAPLNDADRCWVGMRSQKNATQDYLACYDVASGDELWRTRICSAEALGQGSVESTTNSVLTKHDDTIYVSTHLGTVAAVFAETGTIRWLVKYPRRGPGRNSATSPNWHATRDLTPCLVHDDLLIVAPADTNKIFAFHQDDGRLVWQTSVASDVTQLLGVGADDHLIASGRRLWWLDVYTGRVSSKVKVNPFPADATGEPKGVGRGLLSVKDVYWPAVEDDESKIYVLSQSDGTPTRQPIDLSTENVSAGNMIMAGGFVLIAGPKELAAFELAD